MAKKKETEENVVTTEVPDTGLLNKAAPAGTPEIVIAEVDFKDLLDLEKRARATEEQLNKVSGTMYRLTKEQDFLFESEKFLNNEINVKRKDLIKRYQLDEQRAWRIDINTRKVVYSQ